MQQMFQNGVLIINSNNLNYAIKAPEIQRIITAYDTTLGLISEAINSDNIRLVTPTEAAPLRMMP
jgi:hypothetical protein